MFHTKIETENIGGNLFSHTGDSPKWVKSKRRREKEKIKERLNDGNNNGQDTHGARKHAWRMQAAWANGNKATHEHEYKFDNPGSCDLKLGVIKTGPQSCPNSRT